MKHAFDRLPEAVRRAISDYPLAMSAEAALEALEAGRRSQEQIINDIVSRYKSGQQANA
jgi:hypothetical protein